jgi:hypothetical protein
MQVEIAGKAVKVFVFPETTSVSTEGTEGISGGPGKPPVSYPRYIFQVTPPLLLFIAVGPQCALPSG